MHNWRPMMAWILTQIASLARTIHSLKDFIQWSKIIPIFVPSVKYSSVYVPTYFLLAWHFSKSIISWTTGIVLLWRHMSVIASQSTGNSIVQANIKRHRGTALLVLCEGGRWISLTDMANKAENVGSHHLIRLHFPLNSCPAGSWRNNNVLWRRY